MKNQALYVIKMIKTGNPETAFFKTRITSAPLYRKEHK
jgi:hypothetical protein